MKFKDKSIVSYQPTRILYIFEALLEYLVSILVTTTFLAKLSTELGVSDALTGIISAFTSLGCAFELFSMFISRKNGVKKIVIWGTVINELLFIFVYVTPFIPMSSGIKIALYVIFMLVGNVILKVLFSPKVSWYMRLVDDRKRGIFTSVKQIISLAVGMIFSLVMGYISDSFVKAGKKRESFVVLAITLFVLMLLHIGTLVFSKEKIDHKIPESKPLKARVSTLFKNRHFVSVLVVCMLYNIAANITIPFLNTLQIGSIEEGRGLGFTLFYCQILNCVYSVVRIIFEPVWGKIADKYSFPKMMSACVIAEAFGFLSLLFVTPGNGAVVFAIYKCIYAISSAGIVSALMNLVFDAVPMAERSDALAIKNTAFGLSGFLVTLIASPFISLIQNNGNKFLGISLYPQQILALISAVICFVIILYIKKRLPTSKRGRIS